MGGGQRPGLRSSQSFPHLTRRLISFRSVHPDGSDTHPSYHSVWGTYRHPYLVDTLHFHTNRFLISFITAKEWNSVPTSVFPSSIQPESIPEQRLLLDKLFSWLTSCALWGRLRSRASLLIIIYKKNVSTLSLHKEYVKYHRVISQKYLWRCQVAPMFTLQLTEFQTIEFQLYYATMVVFANYPIKYKINRVLINSVWDRIEIQIHIQ